jgi:CRISPR/Cas system CSM-associated protein Csm2 small subunit
MDKELYELLKKFIDYADGTIDTTENEFIQFVDHAKQIVKLYERLYIN